MFRTSLLFGIVACTAKQPRTDSARAVPNPNTVTLDGLGNVKIGASAKELAAALGEQLPPPRVAEVSCRYMRPASLPRGIGIMLVDDSVARIDVDSAGVATAEGASVGDTEAHVTELYRDRVTVAPHKYTGPTGHYLTVTPPGDTLRRIIFETDGQRVTKYRVGRKPAVEWVEGCS